MHCRYSIDSYNDISMHIDTDAMSETSLNTFYHFFKTFSSTLQRCTIFSRKGYMTKDNFILMSFKYLYSPIEV